MRSLVIIFLISLIFSGCAIKHVKQNRPTGSNVILGVQSYSFKDYSIDELLNAMVSLGLRSCELWEGHVASVPIVRDPKALTAWRMNINPAYLKEIKEKFKSRGLSIQAYNANFKDNVTDDELEKAFQAATFLGTKCITSSATVSLMPRLDRFAKKYQVIVAMHNHDLVNKPNEFSTSDSFKRGMDNLSGYIQINLDIGHFTAINQDPVAYIKEMHKKIPCVHIKDRKQNRGARTPFGKGDTPIGEALRLIRDHNWPIVANIELEYPGHTIEEMERSIAFCINELKK